MADHVVKLPDVGEGVAEAEIVEWRVTVGDTVDEDDPLVDVMTDKATVELPSPVAGTITRLGAEVGDVVAVGAELIWIATDGSAGAEDGDAAPAQPEAEAQTEPETEAEATPEPEATPSAEPEAQPEPPPEPEPEPSPDREGPEGRRPTAAPAVRGRARELGIDLATVRGTGPDGRVVHADLDALLAGGAAPGRRVTASPVPIPAAEEDEIERVPVRGLRRRIAAQMEEAHRIPHFTYVEEVDVTELERLRAELNASRPQAPRLTVLPLLMRAVVIAVGDYPQMNALFRRDDGVVERHRAVHLGIATQTDQGLMVPVVRHAEARVLWDSAAEVARLAEGARAGTLTRDELTGSTITITSLGPLGGIVSTPIINAPEVAIIGVNRFVERAVRIDGAWLPRQFMNLSSSFDHRVIDGYDAAEFIQEVRELLETPALLFLPG